MAFEGITLVRCFVESIRRVLPALAKNLWHLFPLLLLVHIVYIVYTPPPLSSSHRGRAPAVANARWDPQGASKNINMVQAWQEFFFCYPKQYQKFGDFMTQIPKPSAIG